MIPELKQIKMQLTLFEQGVENFYAEATKMKEDYLKLQKENEELKKEIEKLKKNDKNN